MRKFTLLALLFLTALPAAAQLPVRPPFRGEWDCSQDPRAGESRTCLPHCRDISSQQWKIFPSRRSCPLPPENQTEEECRSALFSDPPRCCPPEWTEADCNAARLLSRAPCANGHAEVDGKCVPESGGMPATAEVCALFGGLPRTVEGGGICSGVDRDETFCLLSSDSALPCRGLFNQARECNFARGRATQNPFLCGPKCPDGQRALGGKCAPKRRVDFAYLQRHCPPRRYGDQDVFPRQPRENGVYPADDRTPNTPRIGAECLLSRQPYRLCYALDSAFAGLRPDQLKDDNDDLLSNPEFPVFPCDEVLDFCPKGQTDMDGNYFTEGDCEGDPSPHKVDLAYLEMNCPEESETHPRQPVENRIYPRGYTPNASDPDSPAAGKICELSLNPYRDCYALKPDFIGMQRRDLVDDNDDLLSNVLPPTPLCDDALSFCPDGQRDADGNYFTEGDCVPADEGE